MRGLLFIVFLTSALFSLGSTVIACGGYVVTSIENAAQHELFVAAEVVDVDDVGINAILKVDRYFKGTGSEYLTVMRFPPSLQVAGQIRRYHTSCLYSGRLLGFKWQKGSYGYFPLSPNHNGTYRDHWTVATSAHYVPSDGSVEYYSDNEGDRGGNATLPVDEFESHLLRVSEQDHTIEPQSNTYPLMRFLNITIESGARYRLNPHIH